MLTRSKANSDQLNYNESEAVKRPVANNNDVTPNVYEFEENETASDSDQRPKSYEEIEMHSGSATDANQFQNENNDMDYDDITFVGQETDGLLDGDNATYSTGNSQVNDRRKVIFGGNDDEYADIADTDPAGHASSASKINTKAAPRMKPLTEQELSEMYTKPQKNKGTSDEARNKDSKRTSENATETIASKERRIPTEEELKEMYAQPMK